MQKTLPSWALHALTLAGVVLVASMLLNWVDVGGELTASGLRLAWEENHWLFLVPITGVLLAAAAASRSELTRLAAVAAGLVVTGDVAFNVVKGMIHSGAATWLILGGAGAILAGVSKDRRAVRTIGGLAVLVGFFAPWASDSMWNVLTSEHLDLATSMGLTVRVLWVIPVAAIAALATPGATGGKVALGAGIAIYGSFLWVIGSAATFILGWGAWGALGASTLALALGLLAPAAGVRAVPAAKQA